MEISYRRYTLFRSKRFGEAVLILVHRGNCTPIHNHSLPVTGFVAWGSPHEITKSGRHDLYRGDTFSQPVGVAHQVGNDRSRLAIIIDRYPPGTLHMDRFEEFSDAQ